MKINHSYLSQVAALVVAGFPSMASAWEPGVYPVAPARMQSSDFGVDNQNRNDVIAFWHAVYQASEGYENRVGWTGNYSGTPGSTSPEFVADVERRLNYFRAMCGIPANARLNTGSTVAINPEDRFKPSSTTLKSDAAQQFALMLIRNYDSSTGSDPAITHDPASSVTGWSAAGWNAAAHGNFAFGIYGPGAITEYLREALPTGSATSAWNMDVGHRRWCLFPPATNYATGDQPGSSAYRPPTNSLYVLPNAEELQSVTSPAFVSYPSAGFFPAPVNSPYWSLSRADADFSSATVTMTTADGTPLPVVSTRRQTGYGDPAIVWRVDDAAAKIYVFSDTTFQVHVAGIAGDGIPASYDYAVTLINPDRLTDNQSMTGPSAPVFDQWTSYTFVPPPGAEALQVAALLQNSTVWTENAEKPSKAKIIDDTTGGYSLMTKVTAFTGFSGVSGSRSFHLTFPTAYDLIGRGVPEQSFEIDRDIIANSKATLNFSFRRGYMTKTSNLVAEISSNDGLTWKIVGSPIKGVSNTAFDTKPSSVSISLPKSSIPIRVRFRYFTTGGSIYTHDAAPKSPTGIFIDEITTLRGDWLERKKLTTLPTDATEFVFNSQSAGATLATGAKWKLRLQTTLGGKSFNGPVKALTIAAP